MDARKERVAVVGDGQQGDEPGVSGLVESINAITLATRDMARSVAFYRAVGLRVRYGGGHASFTSFHVGEGHLNLILVGPEVPLSWWGRVIFYVDDVDAMHARALSAGLRPEFAPRNADWGERYFHILDPDGHELSFARLLT